MPILVNRFDNPEELTQQEQAELAKLYDSSPEFSDGVDAVQKLKTAMSRGDTLYTAEFNTKKIAAIWVRGVGEKRVLQYVVTHPANRGRGIGEELVKQVLLKEFARGVRAFEPGCGAVKRMMLRVNEQNTREQMATEA